MPTNLPDFSRRAALVRSRGLAGVVAVTMLFGCCRPALAKAQKSDFQYQDHPHSGKDCGTCKFFSANDADGGAGTCAVVDGPINRNGWCLAFSPKA
jgi:hypothetical protein